MDTINVLVILAYIAVNVDIFLQEYRILTYKESIDIAVPGIVLRLFAVTVLTAKFSMLGETGLFVGQLVMTVNVAIYLVLVVRYHRRKRTKQGKKLKTSRKSKKY